MAEGIGLESDRRMDERLYWPFAFNFNNYYSLFSSLPVQWPIRLCKIFMLSFDDWPQ